jgi:S1-C subfamily serine protease
VLRKYSISKSAEGPVVEEVTAGSPAQIAGLQQGDLILSLGENKTPDTETLSYAISATMPGTKTTIRLVRLQREMTVPVTIASPEPGGGGPAPQTSGSSMPASVQGCKAFGSGFAVTDNGYIITNYHVVDGAQKVRVKTDEALLPAQVIATDPDNDLALIKVSKALQPVTFSSERVARLGQTVFTVGFPMPDLQGFSPKVTKGVISGLTGMNDDVKTYQIDASVQPGNSGGPLADESGNVVGVVVARLSGSGIQNVNYSIKLPYVLALFDSFPDVAKSIRYAKGGVKLSFEDAVEKVRRATVMIVVN